MEVRLGTVVEVARVIVVGGGVSAVVVEIVAVGVAVVPGLVGIVVVVLIGLVAVVVIVVDLAEVDAVG